VRRRWTLLLLLVLGTITIGSTFWYFADWRVTVDWGDGSPPLVKYEFPGSFQFTASFVIGVAITAILLTIAMSIRKVLLRRRVLSNRSDTISDL
jgi:hypothetical protein